ncbi:hypothetical protein JOM56_009058, partial [Amanita muscaria]
IQQSVGPGATIVPVIISTDKTQLTLFRNKNAYPIYMTIGNIPKEIRRRPSMRAYVLLVDCPRAGPGQVHPIFAGHGPDP